MCIRSENNGTGKGTQEYRARSKSREPFPKLQTSLRPRTASLHMLQVPHRHWRYPPQPQQQALPCRLILPA